MKTLSEEALGNQLNRSRIIIDNTLANADILALVTPKGYSLAVMQQGKELYEAASKAVNRASEKSGALALAGEHAAESFGLAVEAYQDLAKTCRAVFLRSPATLAVFGLDTTMPRAQGEFAKSFNKLFNTGSYTDEIRAKLAAKGYDSAKLSLERARLGEWEFAAANVKTCDGASQAATAAQTAALRAMTEWVSEYVKIARIALKRQPQLLEKLGIVVRHGKSRAQREAPAKAAATRRLNREAAAKSKVA